MGQLGSGQVDGNSDNRDNSNQFQFQLPTGAELGNKMNCIHVQISRSTYIEKAWKDHLT